MPKTNEKFISVGFHKGEMDFSINGSVIEISQQEMTELRAMIVVAIGTMEDMWRREQMKKYPSMENK